MKALNDRMKAKETVNESWPDLDETSQTPLIDSAQNSSVTIDMTNLNESTSGATKEDLNQPFFDTEQQQQQSS